MTRNTIDLVTPNIEDALTAHDMGDSPMWACGYFVMPTPDGQAAMNGYITISISTPIIGEPNPTATAILDPRILTDRVECDRIVSDLMGRAREMRSQQISAAANALPDPAKPEYDFSRLLK